MIAPKPAKKLPSSTTGFANKKVIMGGTTNNVHHSKEEKQKGAKRPNIQQNTQKEKDQQKRKMTPQDFVDPNYLPFPTRNHKQAVDEQFARFVEMIEKIHVSIQLMDVLHVPSYAKYIKDIINNK